MDISRITEHIRATNPHSSFSIEDVRYVSEGVFRPRKPEYHHRIVPFVHPPEKEKIIPLISPEYESIIKEKTNHRLKPEVFDMISKTMEQALNKQVNRELYSAYLYLSMSSYFECNNLKGFAKWMRVQAKEEQSHALKIYDYLIARGGRINLLDIEAPKAKWSSAGKVFEEVYAHEQKVTDMINGLVDLAMKEKDHASFEMLQWFVKEQVEEEKNASEILAEVTCIGDIPGHLFYLDHKLAKRE